MSRSNRIPVLVGVGALTQKIDDPAEALEPVALMAKALERAGEDAGAPELLHRADAIFVPRGFWEYPDPARWVANAVGADSARTVVSEVGVLQTSLFAKAAQEIADGTADIIAIAGGEAKYRALRAKIEGVEAPLASQPEGEADTVLRPSGDILHRLEIKTGLIMPVQQYSMVENALRFEDGMSLAAHRDEVARMWSAMSDVAVQNPEAWNRTALPQTAIRNPGNGNPMLAFPYTKHHNSQWNVDQAAGLVLCSSEKARKLGISPEKWIYPWAITESNHMQAFSEREKLSACPGFEIAGDRAFELSQTEVSEIRYRELYSCFPSAVRIQAREMGIDLKDSLTVTGGMTFAGGPLNNFVLQATVRMAKILRDDAGSRGLINCVSGVLTKQAVTIWSAAPPPMGFQFEDVTHSVSSRMPKHPLALNENGPAVIRTYTVVYQGDTPQRAVAICDTDENQRTLATSEDPDLMRAMTEEEFCGHRVHLAEGKIL